MLISHEIAEALERSEIEYMTDRMLAIQEREGNPEGIEIQQFGQCTAFYSRTMQWALFNNVKGTLDPEVLDDILRFYSERERSFEFQIIPNKADQQVMKLLYNKGFYQSGFHTTLYCKAREVDFRSEHDLHIRELREDEFDTYAEIHCLGTGLSLDGMPYVAANNQVLYQRSGWRFYIGFLKEQPAAVAVMYMQNNMASLTFAATLPEYRNRGLQTNLLLRRIHDAYLNNCELVVSQCSYCSPSHRNMERAGMKIGYTRATWTKV